MVFTQISYFAQIFRSVWFPIDFAGSLWVLFLSGRKKFRIIVFCHQEMELKVGCFYVVKFNTKKTPVFYVGKMIGEDEISEDILMSSIAEVKIMDSDSL